MKLGIEALTTEAQRHRDNYLCVSVPLWLMTFFLFLVSSLNAAHTVCVSTGVDVFLSGGYDHLLKGKRVGLITNHTAVNCTMESTASLLKKHAQEHGYILAAFFAPEHGIDGSKRSEEWVRHGKDKDGIPVFSLYEATKRPTKAMLDAVDVFVYDIQDIGSRSYTYISTLFFVMEEAAKHGKRVVVLDRPNPINGLTVDGPMLEEAWRSVVGYVNVPYCHGMTIGELARYFNGEYKIGCTLDVIPMKGWKRSMSFAETGLPWVPTSPHVPEASTALFYPMTGMIGELQIVNIGVWYSLPFKVVGAPWIDAEDFAARLNAQHFPGVRFHPLHYQPFAGRLAKQDCHGVLIVITDEKIYKPVSTQFLLIGMLKSLYPNAFDEAVQNVPRRKDMFCKVMGTEEVYRLITQEKFIIWKLKDLHQKEREQFLLVRQKYLLPSYAD